MILVARDSRYRTPARGVLYLGTVRCTGAGLMPRRPACLCLAWPFSRLGRRIALGLRFLIHSSLVLNSVGHSEAVLCMAKRFRIQRHKAQTKTKCAQCLPLAGMFPRSEGFFATVKSPCQWGRHWPEFVCLSLVALDPKTRSHIPTAMPQVRCP